MLARRMFRANSPPPRPDPLLLATLDDLSIDDNLSQVFAFCMKMERV